MRREYLNGTGGLPDVPFAEDCIFYAPLSYNDLTDHISGVQGVIQSGTTLEWNSSMNMYLIKNDYLSNAQAQGGVWFDIPGFQKPFTLFARIQEVSNDYLWDYAVDVTNVSGANNYPFSKGYFSLSTLCKCVLVCYTSGTTYYYKNSSKVSTFNWTSFPIFNRIKLVTNNSGYKINHSYVSDVRIYNRTLSDSEIAQL